MSQLQVSLLGEPIMKHGEDKLTFSTRKALALLVYLAVEGGAHAKPSPNPSGQNWMPSMDAPPYVLPSSSCVSSLSARTVQASRRTCWLSAIRLDSIRTAHSCWTFASLKLSASK
jgi:hypothetical protein